MKTAAVTLALFAVAGCSGPSSTESVSPDAAEPTATEAAASPAPTPAPGPSTPEPAMDSKAALSRAVMGAQDLGDWSVRMGYDLGMLRMLVLTRPADANPVTVAQLTDGAPGVSEDGMTAVFGGAEIAGAHPFELLGYDHVQFRAGDHLQAAGRELPRVEFSWLRVDPDTSERESGRGTAIWMHCGATASEAKAIDGRWLVLASETLGTEHDAGPVSELAGRLRVCGGS